MVAKRRDLRTRAEQQEHETYTEIARQLGGDEVCDVCGEWKTVQRQPGACDCGGQG